MSLPTVPFQGPPKQPEVETVFVNLTPKKTRMVFGNGKICGPVPEDFIRRPSLESMLVCIKDAPGVKKKLVNPFLHPLKNMILPAGTLKIVSLY